METEESLEEADPSMHECLAFSEASRSSDTSVSKESALGPYRAGLQIVETSWSGEKYVNLTCPSTTQKHETPNNVMSKTSSDLPGLRT
jgi:hypothetical protein